MGWATLEHLQRLARLPCATRCVHMLPFFVFNYDSANSASQWTGFMRIYYTYDMTKAPRYRNHSAFIGIILTALRNRTTTNDNRSAYCMVITYSKGKEQPGKVVLLVVSWTGKIIFSLSPFAPENLVSRDGFGRPVPRQPAHLHIQAEYGAYLRYSSRFSRRRPFIFLNRHAPSGQSRFYRVTQLRTDGVHCRESAGIGLVNLKVVPNGCCLVRSPWTN